MPRDIYGRSRHATQAYGVTSFGKSFESGVSGYGRRLQGTNPGFILLDKMIGPGTFILGDLTAGSWVNSLTSHTINTGGTITMDLFDPNDAAFVPIPLISAASIAILGSLALIQNAKVILPRDLALRAVVTGGLAAPFTTKLSLEVVPSFADWS